MAEFSHTIAIEAPASRVWEVWMDVERWPEWSTPMKKVEKLTPGELKAGTRAKIDFAGGPASTWEVTDVRPHQYFAWEANVRGVRALAGHEVVEQDGKSNVTLSVAYSGILAMLLRPMLMRTARRNVVAEAEGLKQRCESGTTG